jgi:hypothetical protein
MGKDQVLAIYLHLISIVMLHSTGKVTLGVRVCIILST